MQFDRPTSGTEPLLDEQGRLIHAVRKLKRKDLVGVAGEYMSAAAGALGGVGAAGTVASVAGATTLWGSTTLGGLLGGVFVVSTPVGWVIGTAAVAGVAGLAIAKLVRSGALQDAKREDYIRTLEERIQHEETVAGTAPAIDNLVVLLDRATKDERMSATTSDRIVTLVKSKRLSLEEALDRVRKVTGGVAR